MQWATLPPNKNPLLCSSLKSVFRDLKLQEAVVHLFRWGLQLEGKGETCRDSVFISVTRCLVVHRGVIRHLCEQFRRSRSCFWIDHGAHHGALSKQTRRLFPQLVELSYRLNFHPQFAMEDLYLSNTKIVGFRRIVKRSIDYSCTTNPCWFGHNFSTECTYCLNYFGWRRG